MKRTIGALGSLALVMVLLPGHASAARVLFEKTFDLGAHADFNVFYDPEGALGLHVIDVTANYSMPGNVVSDGYVLDCTSFGDGDSDGPCFFNLGADWFTVLATNSALGDVLVSGFNVEPQNVDTSPGDPILIGTFGIDYSGPVDLIVSGAPASNFGNLAGPLPNNSPPGTVLFHVPEPGAAVLLGVGLAALVLVHRRRARGARDESRVLETLLHR